MYNVDDMPPIDGGELEQLIDEHVQHEEFLFFRINHGDDLDWILGEAEDYECFCTACQQHFAEDRKSGPAKHWTECPKCGHRVTPRQWRQGGACESVRFAFHFFQRGYGRAVWLSSVQVTMNRRFTESKYEGFEYARYCFFDGGARKWTRGRDYFFGEHPWTPVKAMELKHWSPGYGRYCDDCWAPPTADELAGSCIEYAQVEQAYTALDDLTGYLALYCRYPAAVEHLVKRGFIFWRRERENRGGALFQRLINLRANSPKKLFRGLDRADLRVLLASKASLGSALFYRELRRAGAGRADKDSVFFATKASAVLLDFSQFSALCADFGQTPKEVRKYIERQARRADQMLHAALVELRDYREQLDRLGLDGGRLPPDLHEAHMRLTRREAQLMHHAENAKFRARRHLLRWMNWRHGGCFIRPVDSAEEIVREGEEQDNCVASYADRHANGETIIMLLRQCSAPGTSWHTVEIDPKTLDCLQCYGYKNRKRTPDAAEFMDAYINHLREAARMNGRKVM